MIQSFVRLFVLVFTATLIGCGNDVQVLRLAPEAAEDGRTEISLDHDWEFHKGELSVLATRIEQDEEQEERESNDFWQEIDLPHTWNAEDGYDGGGDYYRGDGWYRKQIKLTDSLAGKQIYLHFDGANQITDLYIDGQHIGQHRGGYGAFRFDLTSSLTPGVEHELAVKVNNSHHNDIAPWSADYTFFGGIYRSVHLLVTEPEHIEVMNYASPGVFIQQASLTDERANVEVAVNLMSQSATDSVRTLSVEIKDGTGNVVASATKTVSLQAQTKISEVVDLEVLQPRRWNGVNDPYLYQVSVQLMAEKRVLDSVVQPLGLREFYVDPEKGLILNGEYYDVKGVSRHQDFEGKGWALDREDHKRDFDLIEEMGASGIRLAHYQHDPYVYDLMDEKGFVTWAEIPLINKVPESQAFEENAAQQLKELIRQNYNHPSILFWGVSNEVSLTGLSQGGVEILERLNSLAKTEDSQRLSTAAVLGHHDGEPIWFVNDVVAQNVYYGWYYDDIKGLGRWADASRAAYPNRAFGVSEYGAGAGVSIHSAQPVQGDHSEEFQNLYHEGSWEELDKRPYIWSKFIWNMFDFAVDGRDEGERPGMNDKGLVSYDRKTKKDSFYWYKANWSDEPVLYISSRRFTERKRSSVDIKIYTNLQQVELQVNGDTISSKQSLGQARLIWSDIELEMGENKIEVFGRDKQGKKLVDQTVWHRIENDDTDISSSNGVIGIDVQQHRVFHLPYETTVEQLAGLIQVPFGAALDMSITGVPDKLVSVGDEFAVIAGNGDRQRYQVAEGALSVARPIKPSDQMSNGIMGYPAAPAYKAVDGSDDLSFDRDNISDLETTNFWLTGDPTGGSAHYKIDLGADYYIDRTVSTWLPDSINAQGTVQYTIELAANPTLDETTFVETYVNVVDRRNNTTALVTEDVIKKVGRYVRVNVLDSSYRVDIPIAGSLRLIGATELSVEGGLLFSDTLKVDYRRHQLSVPSKTTVAELKRQIKLVSEEYSVQVMSDSAALTDNESLTSDSYLVVASNKSSNPRRERYWINIVDGL
jgi:Glycosyl hydrolases family 2, TIM barrel domain/Glycosyl hydrolases family 2, sugar binding domain/Glycosyl hydrolases family 2/Domain of unknown function (DUF4982)